MNPTPLGWRSRGYLPHLDIPGLTQMISFRLEDSMPSEVVNRWQQELRFENHEKRIQEVQSRVEDYLDAGHGECLLKDSRIAELVEHAFLFFDGKRYRLVAWVVMPNHVHVLIETIRAYPLDKVIHSWKSYTSLEANRILGRQGPFWQREYYDRYMRDDAHLMSSIDYIHRNPVKAGLVSHPEDWRFSSARRYIAMP